VCELDADFLALRVREFYDLAQRLLLRIFPETAVFGCNSSFGLYGGGLDECQTGTALDDTAQVCEVPVRLVTVFGGVLAERGEGEAVLDRHAAELEGLEELGDLGAAVEHGKGGSGDGLLCGSEVGNLDGSARQRYGAWMYAYTRSGLVPQLIVLRDLFAILILGDILCDRMMRVRLVGISLDSHYGGCWYVKLDV